MSKLDALAKALGVSSADLIDAARPFREWGSRIGVTPLELLKTALRNFDVTNDGRAVDWIARLRLYTGAMEDAEADSDPDLPPDAQGTEVVKGLVSVCYWAAALARNYHQGVDLGLGFEEEFTKRISTVRPALSRNDGVATWRIPYMVNGAKWLARIDLVRQAPAPNAAETVGLRRLLTEIKGQGYESQS